MNRIVSEFADQNIILAYHYQRFADQNIILAYQYQDLRIIIISISGFADQNIISSLSVSEFAYQNHFLIIFLPITLISFSLAYHFLPITLISFPTPVSLFADQYHFATYQNHFPITFLPITLISFFLSVSFFADHSHIIPRIFANQYHINIIICVSENICISYQYHFRPPPCCW